LTQKGSVTFSASGRSSFRRSPRAELVSVTPTRIRRCASV
jgi:hypothetical protein